MTVLKYMARIFEKYLFKTPATSLKIFNGYGHRFTC